MMKNKFIYLFTALFAAGYSYGQVGIGTTNPEKGLDVNGDVTIRRELRVNGTDKVPGDPGEKGQVLTVDDNGKYVWKKLHIPTYVKNSFRLVRSYIKSDTEGIILNKVNKSEKFERVRRRDYDLNSPDSPWQVIKNLEADVVIGNIGKSGSKNRVAFVFQTGVEFKYANTDNKISVNYACGIFVNDKLKIVRVDEIGFDVINNIESERENAKLNREVFLMRGTLVMTKKTNNVKVACVRGSNNDLALDRLPIVIGTPLDPSASSKLTQKSSLKIDVLEY